MPLRPLTVQTACTKTGNTKITRPVVVAQQASGRDGMHAQANPRAAQRTLNILVQACPTDGNLVFPMGKHNKRMLLGWPQSFFP